MLSHFSSCSVSQSSLGAGQANFVLLPFIVENTKAQKGQMPFLLSHSLLIELERELKVIDTVRSAFFITLSCLSRSIYE